MSEKATGWKVPLLFCAAIAGLTILGIQFMPEADKPELPPELVRKARSVIIDLDNPDGKSWHDAIVDAASGFAPQEAKDIKLAAIFNKAMSEGRLDGACAAVVHLRDSDLRARALRDIFSFALEKCENLPWGVFAVNAENDSATAGAMARELGTAFTVSEV